MRDQLAYPPRAGIHSQIKRSPEDETSYKFGLSTRPLVPCDWSIRSEFAAGYNGFRRKEQNRKPSQTV